jgi:hypothetical protein
MNYQQEEFNNPIWNASYEQPQAASCLPWDRPPETSSLASGYVKVGNVEIYGFEPPASALLGYAVQFINLTCRDVSSAREIREQINPEDVTFTEPFSWARACLRLRATLESPHRAELIRVCETKFSIPVRDPIMLLARIWCKSRDIQLTEDNIWAALMMIIKDEATFYEARQHPLVY